MRALRILETGPLATIQDRGRFGYRDRGVPLSGAMDQTAYRIGNFLVGNREDSASIEITWGGFKAQFCCDVCFAITGAHVDARLGSQLLSSWAPWFAKEGNVLTLGYARSGLRGYLSLSGGVDVPQVMGSRSTYVRGGFGGLHGRALQKGDSVALGEATGKPIHEDPLDLIPNYSDNPTLKVILGPQDDLVTDEGLAAFLSADYEVTDRSDRMGYALSGPAISHREGADIISDGTVPGAVQVPGSGQPTILAADCQTTGGYVKVATVISSDLPLLAQLQPGCKVRFASIALTQAREIYLNNEYRLRSFCERRQNTP